MGFLAKIRSMLARGSSKGPGGPTVITSWGLGRGSPRRGTRELFQAYRDSPWLHAIENRLAQECATASRLLLYSGPEDDALRAQIDVGDPRYELLRVWRRPTQLVTGQVMSVRQRTKALALWYWLAGEAFVVKQRGALGQVVGLVPISPLWVLSFPTLEQPYYVVQVDASRPETMQAVAPRDMIPIVDSDAENPYGRGCGVAASLADELDTDDAVSKMVRAEYANHGMPSGMVVLKGASPQARKQVKADWVERFQGPEKAGQVEFFEGDAQWIPMARPNTGSESVEMRRFLRDTFMQAHGFSPEILGVLDGSTRDSTDAAYYHLSLGALVPWCGTLCDALQTHLVPDFTQGEDVWVGHKSPVPDDRKLQLQAIATAPSAFRVRDVRTVGGFAPDAERSDQLLTEKQIQAGPTQVSQPRGASQADPVWAQALAGVASKGSESGS